MSTHKKDLAPRFVGVDIGSSAIKIALLNGATGQMEGRIQLPEQEFAISSPRSGWAEQPPELWWETVCSGVQKLMQQAPFPKQAVKGIGITYQMHGLVAVDKMQQTVRPAIIWCDSRAVQTGELAAGVLGIDWCLENLLNTPGNFTAARLKWVADNEPEIYSRIDKIMLPGDYIAMKMTGDVTTTASGLSEAVLWHFKEQRPAIEVLQAMDLDPTLLPDLVPGLGVSGELCAVSASQLGLLPGVKIAYRAGDQINNALSLNVLGPGEIAATAGTSGVIYAVSEKQAHDPKQRINSFLHINAPGATDASRTGLLACINGAGRAYSWLRSLFSAIGQIPDYAELNRLAAQAQPGCDRLNFYPFGNGAERIFNQASIGSHMTGLDFNRHTASHLARAVQEGIAFAMASCLNSISDLGIECAIIRAGNANLFKSDLFSQVLANSTGLPVQIFNSDGAEGAARAAAWGVGFYRNRAEAFQNLQRQSCIEPDRKITTVYREKYVQWTAQLEHFL